MAENHTGQFAWFLAEGRMPAHGQIVGNEDDPDTGYPFNINVHADAIFSGLDLTVRHKKTPVIYTARKVPGFPVYHALTVTKQ